ncbi:MAG: right-handed parallel beta-helix repeat-containing protein [Pseudomonadota bacterium]
MIITVTTLDDVVDAMDGLTSLREAVALANETEGFDEIVFKVDGVLSIDGGDMQITDDVSINGDRNGDGLSDLVLSGTQNHDRLFEVTSGAALSLSNLTVRQFQNEGDGGVLLVNSGASAEIDNVDFAFNQAGNGSGGVIFNEGSVSIRDSMLDSNSATQAGAIQSSGILEIVNTKILDNTTSDPSGTLVLSGTATIVNSSIFDNTSDGNGAIDLDGDLTLVGTTIANNTSDGDLSAVAVTAASTLVVDQSTITGHLGGGIQTLGTGNVTLRNSIVSGNGTSGQRLDLIDPSGTGAVLEGRNILGDQGFILGSLAYSGIAGTDIFLEADANDAGLLNAARGTVALNPFFEPANLLRAFGGNYGELFPQDTLDTDNDGVTGETLPLDGNGGYRDQGSNGIEIGAVEAEGLVVTTLSDTSAADGELTLREAIALAEANEGADTITFAAHLLEGREPGGRKLEIELDNQLVISSEITIEGDIDGDRRGDILLDGQDLFRIFNINDTGNLRIDGLTLTKAYSGSNGGAVVNHGTFIATNTSFRGNLADSSGGALFNAGAAILGNVTFASNRADTDGGAINNIGGLSVINGTFVSNFANLSGGAVHNDSQLSVDILHSTFTGNRSLSGDGGAIFSDVDTRLTLESSIVTGNTAGFERNSSNVGGNYTQLGNNLIGPERFTNGNYNGRLDIEDVFDGSATGVGILADHGGPVETVAPGLAANGGQINRTDVLDLDGDGDVTEVIDTAANGVFRDPSFFPTLGAHEVSNRLVVTTLSDESFNDGSLSEEINDGDGLSLREALGIAAGTSTVETITFASDLAGGTLLLDNTPLSIADTVIVDGDIDGDGKADITLDAQGNFRALEISAGAADSDVTLNALTITGGRAHGVGGGIRVNADQSLTLTNSTVIDNFSSDGGGGIWANRANLTIENSLITGNTTAGAGAGLFLIRGTHTIFNTTIANNDTNTFYGSDGGGIYSDFANLSIESSTITDNSAYRGGGIENLRGDTITVVNSIIAGNRGLFDDEVSDDLTLQGGNIIGAEISQDGSVTGTTTTDRVFAETQELVDFFGGGFDAQAGVLRDNGGAVRTVALLRGGDAIDIGDASELDMTKTTDARGEGFARIVGPKEDGQELDLGAYEEQIPDQPALATVDPFIRLGEDGDTTTGAISIDDPDAGDNPSFANAIGTPLGDDIGDLQINAAGDTIEFTLDKASVQDLAGGEAANVRYELFADDGTRTTVLVNIRGADDGTPEDDAELNGSFVADIIDGLAGDDTLNGFADDDILIGGEGADRLNGGAGNDTASFAGSFNLNRADLQGLTFADGDAEGDVYNDIENLQGGERIDLLFGDGNDNTVDGSNGNDRTIGRAGDDVLLGGAGFDKLYGNSGADIMTGGGNRDRFIYFSASDSRAGEGNRDIITDFDPSEGETIEIGRLDADETRGGNQRFEFIGTDQFTDAGQLRFFQAVNSNTTFLLANTDDDSAAEFQIELTGLITLTEDNFIL